jgi:protein involved in polysaccharide export with SLBB domain
LLQAIAKAGGFTDTAAIDRVSIVRKAGGQETAVRVKVSDLLRGRRQSEDLDLQFGDVITVPQTVF